MGRKETHRGLRWAKPEGKKSLGKMRHRWEDNIKMNFKETGWEAVKRLHVPHDRVGMRDPLEKVLHIRFAQNAWVFLGKL
jgi:hypothetical protein